MKAGKAWNAKTGVCLPGLGGNLEHGGRISHMLKASSKFVNEVMRHRCSHECTAREGIDEPQRDKTLVMTSLRTKIQWWCRRTVSRVQRTSSDHECTAKRTYDRSTGWGLKLALRMEFQKVDLLGWSLGIQWSISFCTKHDFHPASRRKNRALVRRCTKPGQGNTSHGEMWSHSTLAFSSGSPVCQVLWCQFIALAR
jgi:hypothetical protein